MIFNVIISPTADLDIKKLKRSEPISYKKAMKY
jgi:hypothetical protein